MGVLKTDTHKETLLLSVCCVIVALVGCLTLKQMHLCEVGRFSLTCGCTGMTLEQFCSFQAKCVTECNLACVCSL